MVFIGLGHFFMGRIIAIIAIANFFAANMRLINADIHCNN